MKLSAILEDIQRDLKTAQKRAIKNTESKVLSQLKLERIFNSGVLSELEVKVLREYIEYRGSTLLINENTIKMVDSEFLKEGVIDWLKQKGQQATDALKSGWNTVKGIWSNFKDFVAGLVQQIKSAFKKAYDFAKKKLMQLAGWIKDLPSKGADVLNKLDDNAKKALASEFKNLSSCTSHLNQVVQKFINGDQWEGNVLNGKGSVSENIFEDIKVLSAIKSLKEGGAIHPEDMLKKYPILHKVVKYTIEILKWTFNLPFKLVQTVIEKVTKGILEGVGFLSSKTGGPGPFIFAALGTLLAEGAEILGHNMETVHHGVEGLLEATTSLIKASFAWAGPVADIFATTVHVIMTFTYYYAIAVLVLNIGKHFIQLIKNSKAKVAPTNEIKISFSDLLSFR